MSRRLAFHETFLPELPILEKHVLKLTCDAVAKFNSAPERAGVHLEPVLNARDPRIRTIRIDRSYRGVVLAPETGEVYCLLKVLPHEDAYRYARDHRASVNPVTGVIEISNAEVLSQAEPALTEIADNTSERLFADVSDSDLLRLGIESDTLKIVRLLPTEDYLRALDGKLPDSQYDTLCMLAAGYTPEQAWEEISRRVPADQVDTGDLVAAMERSGERVVFVSSEEELQEILGRPFAKWRVFLHPDQQKIAYANSYVGPVQVTGGAGTGKTVTALHRARFLAERARERPLSPHATAPILFTTFTRNLADALETQFHLLVEDQDIRRQVQILNVDRLVRWVAERELGIRPVIVDYGELMSLLERESEHVGARYSAVFLEREWEQVMLAQDLRSLDDYLTCRRAGQGVALGRAQRTEVWEVISRVTGELRARKQWGWRQLASEAARVARPVYRHVIVDEAQDLDPAQWRLLRAVVAPGPDDLFVVGDPHQRIYDSRVSLAATGINVRGRSRRLTVNYRTTQEILTWALPALGTAPAVGLDDRDDTLAGYRSLLHGHKPTVRWYATDAEEMAGLTDRVLSWIDSGIEPHAIAVAARSGHLVRKAAGALRSAGIDQVMIGDGDAAEPDAVRIGTMHRMKGLEFQAVAVIGVGAGMVPAAAAVTSTDDDPVAHKHDLQRERCLLFVACTRARDHLYLSYTGEPSPFLTVVR